MLCYLLSASDRSPKHQSSDQVVLSPSAISGVNDSEATPKSDHIDQPTSLANLQQPEEDATIPNYVLISKPGSLFQAQDQENNVSSTTPLHLVAFQMPYSSSDMFCQIHPIHSSNMNYSLSPVLVPLTCTGSTQSQTPSSHAQRPNYTSHDAGFLPAIIPHFLGPSPVCTHTSASCLPVFNVLPAQALYMSHGSDSSLVQNQAPVASSDPVHIPAASDSTVTERPSFRLPTAERYIELGMFYESSQYHPKMHNPNNLCL